MNRRCTQTCDNNNNNNNIAVLSASAVIPHGQGMNKKGNVSIVALFPLCEKIQWGEVKPSKNHTREFYYHHTPGLSHLASYLLGLNHFNTRNPVVVPSLRNFAPNCSIQLNTDYILDTRSNAHLSVERFMNFVYQQHAPDAVVGGFMEQISMDLSVVTSGLSIPFLTYGSYNRRLVTPYFFPQTSLLSTEVSCLGLRLVQYLLYRQRDNYVAVLYAATDANLQLNAAIVNSDKFKEMKTIVRSYAPPILGESPGHDIHSAVDNIAFMGYKTILLLLERPEDELPYIAEAAARNNMKDYFWIIVGTADRRKLDVMLQRDCLIADLLKGAAYITELDGYAFRHHEGNQGDGFLQSWRAQDSRLVQELNNHSPNNTTTLGNDYFQEFMPAPGSSFVYDTVIAIGMGYCQAMETGRTNVEGIRSVDFIGASGRVKFARNSSHPGQRKPETITFGAYNFQPNNTDLFVLTDLFRGTGDVSTSRWQQVNQFLYADGSPNAPLLRITPNKNFLTPVTKIIGFTAWGTCILLILSSAAWVVIYRKHRVVKASQHIFLLWISFGCLVLSVAIFTNSFDEVSGLNTRQLGYMCTATPWLLVTGHIITYSALFSKLWRVNEVLQFRRSTVKISQVLWPVVVLLVVVLTAMTVWTILEGFHWVRIETDTVTGETVGKCDGKNSTAYFAPIFVLTIIPTLLTLWMSYKTRDVHSLYSESKRIYILIVVQVQALVIAIPVLNILEDSSSNGRYLGQLMIFLTFCLSPVMIVIFPKIWAVHFQSNKRSKRRGDPSSLRISGIESLQDLGIQESLHQQQQSNSTDKRRTSLISARSQNSISLLHPVHEEDFSSSLKAIMIRRQSLSDRGPSIERQTKGSNSSSEGAKHFSLRRLSSSDHVSSIGSSGVGSHVSVSSEWSKDALKECPL